MLRDLDSGRDRGMSIHLFVDYIFSGGLLCISQDVTFFSNNIYIRDCS